MQGCRCVCKHTQDVLFCSSRCLLCSGNRAKGFESFTLESDVAPYVMRKRRSGGHVHHHTLKTIRAVVLGKDGVGKSGTLNIHVCITWLLPNLSILPEIFSNIQFILRCIHDCWSIIAVLNFCARKRLTILQLLSQLHNKIQEKPNFGVCLPYFLWSGKCGFCLSNLYNLKLSGPRSEVSCGTTDTDDIRGPRQLGSLPMRKIPQMPSVVTKHLR